MPEERSLYLFASVLSAAIFGVEVCPVQVEADVSNGLPSFIMVGFPSAQVKEAQERVRTALKNNGYQFPPKRITVNFAPADMKKEGAGFDVPVAAAVLAAFEMISPQVVSRVMMAGEIGLDGEIHGISGILPIVLCARSLGSRFCVVPYENLKEGRLIRDVPVAGVKNLQELVECLKNPEPYLTREIQEEIPSIINTDMGMDFSDIEGQEGAKRAAEIAVSGFHNLLLIGPPGTGKTSCALKKMVETFHADKDAQILLLSYTNRAVDEICKSLASIDPAVDFIRVGSELSCDEAYRGHLIENELSSCNRRSEVYERIRNCRIIVGTVAAISGKPELFRLKHFDVAIIDEATQILEPQLLGILCARGEDGKDAIDKFVLIGDHKQLPAVVQQNTEQSAIYDESLLSIGLTNLKDSLFERLYRNCTATVHRSYDMLCRQGRMHPEVALFANRAFYGGRLIPVGLPHQIESSDTICRLAFYPSVPEKAGASAKINYSEARIVADLAARIYEDHQTDFDESRTLGIITPYRSQIALIKKEIESLGIPALNRILVDTVERFQGSERDVIIYSFCVNYPYQLKFLSNLTEEEGVLIDRKLNVALTRARKQMFITGVPELLERNPLYKSLLKLIESF